MSNLMVRLIVFILIVVVLWIVTWMGRRFVEMRRRQALAAAPYIENAGRFDGVAGDPARDSKQARVRILAFQSEDCRQCHTLQTPALKRLLEACGDSVVIVEVDAPAAPELTERYRVLTLPTTVVLDAGGNARAINYGFASTQKLLEQVNGLLKIYQDIPPWAAQPP